MRIEQAASPWAVTEQRGKVRTERVQCCCEAGGVPELPGCGSVIGDTAGAGEAAGVEEPGGSGKVESEVLRWRCGRCDRRIQSPHDGRHVCRAGGGDRTDEDRGVEFLVEPSAELLVQHGFCFEAQCAPIPAFGLPYRCKRQTRSHGDPGTVLTVDMRQSLLRAIIPVVVQKNDGFATVSEVQESLRGEEPTRTFNPCPFLIPSLCLLERVVEQVDSQRTVALPVVGEIRAGSNNRLPQLACRSALR